MTTTTRLRMVFSATMTTIALRWSLRASAFSPSWSSSRASSSLGGSSGVGRDLDEVLAVGEAAARAAGAIARSADEDARRVRATKANARDLVTASDLACQRAVERVVSEAFPDDSFLGEEDVAAGSDASAAALTDALRRVADDDALLWIVDPIDGTTNFQAGLPLYCVSVGVLSPSTGEVVVGLVYNPALDEMTSAVRGRGLVVDGVPLNASSSSTSTLALSESVVNVGFPVAGGETTLRLSSRAVAVLRSRVRGLRMIASAAQVMAWVARGNLQAYVSWDLNAWDVAAGTLLVREAGGSVRDLNRRDDDDREAGLECRDLCVTSANAGTRTRDELLSVLRDHDCVRY